MESDSHSYFALKDFIFNHRELNVVKLKTTMLTKELNGKSTTQNFTHTKITEPHELSCNYS